MSAILTELADKLDKAKEIARFVGVNLFGRLSTPSPRPELFERLQSPATPMGELLYSGNDHDTCLRDADRICNGELKIYDLDPALFKAGIDWHRDYYSGHRWPIQPFNRIYDPNDSGVDLNVPFEVSRMQFVPTLIQAHRISDEEKYLQNMTAVILYWIRKNPYGFGVNWWSPMEVGLRAFNIFLAAASSWGFVSVGTSARLLGSLWDHARYIYRYDIRKKRTRHKNNHFLGAMLGLLSASLCFRGRLPRKLQRIAVDALLKEIPRQFYEDGGNFESAAAYHQYSLEVVLSVFLLLRMCADIGDDSGQAILSEGKGIRERILNAARIVEDYMTCYGESPNIGDSSDCRVFVFRHLFERSPADHGFIGALAHQAIGFQPASPRRQFASVYPTSGLAFVKTGRYGVVSLGWSKRH